MRRRDAARSRWRTVGHLIAATWAFRSATSENPQISTEASLPTSDYPVTANPLSSFSSSMTSPISRWRLLKHVIFAVAKFQSALRRRRHLASGLSRFSTIGDWSDVATSSFFDFGPFQSPTRMQGLDPPFGSSPSLSRWRLVKHVIVATLRMQSGRRRGVRRPKQLTGTATSPISRWRLLKHVILAVVKFQSALRKRHLASGSSHFPIHYEWLNCLLLEYPTRMQGLDPPFRSSPSLSRWRIVKHVIVATLRMQWGRRWDVKLPKRSRSMRAAVSLPKLPDLELKSVIGTDESSGKVSTAVHRHTGQAYALKELLCNPSQQPQMRREVEILKELDHPNLVKIYGIFFADDSGVSYLLLEPLYSGSPSATSESELASLARQLLLGLAYLHRKRIMHGDIKPSNIFVDHSGQVKLLYSGETLSQTPPLSAEIGGIHDGFSWDIWSVGLCILKWCKGLNWSDRDAGFVGPSGLMPVRAASGQKQPLSLDLSMSWMDVGLNKDVAPSASSSQSEGALVWKPSIGLLNLLSACMRTDVHDIQTAEKLVEHPFFFQLPMEKEVQLLPWKKEFQFSSKMEVQLPPSKIRIPQIKEEFQTARLEKDVQIPLKKEKLFFHEREELLSLVKKKPKTSEEDHHDDDDGVYDMESPKDPTRGVPHEVPKRCIEHCKLFLPDCEFDKDKLVRMWIAEGYIDLGVTKRMEDVGNLYFDALVEEEVIATSKFDNVQRQMKYKFNKSQLGLLEQGNYLRINASSMDGIHKEVLHLTWQCKRLDRTFSDALKDLKQLHTLVVHEDCSASISQLPSDIFLGLRLLKTLDLSRTHISEMPGSIGKLESLQYLDLSETPIKRLPESLDRLYSLQTLNLKACVGVTTLPRGFGRLVNLRHLDLDVASQLKSMPRGMGNLIDLQTLQAFIVGKNDGCGIGELKNMNEITGSFCISRLENVTNAKEAKEAALCDKRYIEKLELRWRNCGNDNFQDTVEILESLQPHFGLKELQLTFYGGSNLPRWISNPGYTDLSSMTLYKCINCDTLPSIGELPSLKILHVFSMENLRNINTVFCRNHEKKVFNAFPRLEKLTLDSMPLLEEWTGVEDGDFPCLRHVSIKYCPKLRVLPSLLHLSSLEHLEISNCMQLISLPVGSLPPSLDSLIIRSCPGLNERCRKDGGVDWSKIASVGNIWIDLEKISLN